MICCQWVWTGPGDLLLSVEDDRWWWDVTSTIRWQMTKTSTLAAPFLFPSWLRCFCEASWPIGESHVAGTCRWPLVYNQQVMGDPLSNSPWGTESTHNHMWGESRITQLGLEMRLQPRGPLPSVTLKWGIQLRQSDSWPTEAVWS